VIKPKQRAGIKDYQILALAKKIASKKIRIRDFHGTEHLHHEVPEDGHAHKTS